MKFELIENAAKRWWRLFSVQMMGLSIAIQGAWSAFGDDLKTYIPHAVASGLSVALLLLGIGGRVVKQNMPSCPPKDPQ